MPHETALISMIALGLVFAFIGGFIAHRIGLPPLVGYVLAGVAIGPSTPGFVGDLELAGQLAEIGVILLMFGVGLHFSIKDLLAVRGIAIPGAIGQIAAATAVGIGMAMWWGWGLGAGLVFGLALSVASTVVLLRALEQRNLLDTPNGRIAVGWLIVEDLVMVLALVLLPAVAGMLGGTGQGAPAAVGALDLATTMAITLGKVALFVALVLVVGRRLVPWLLAQAARTGSREIFTLAVLALALGLAFSSAELFGVSFALGAFFAGVVLSESDLSHQAAADSLPLQDAFAVLFFVSVGMLFEPSILWREPLPVLGVLAVIVLVKSAAAFGIVTALGYPVGTALTVSASLAQIGEFSFILIGLGLTLGLLPPDGRDLILAGAILSITLNPFVFALVDPIQSRLKARGAKRHGPAPSAREDRLATLGGSSGCAVRDHAVIVGHGRVGSTIADALTRHGLPFVVVDSNRRRVEDLRGQGIDAIYGDAAAPGVLDAASIDCARLVVIATPDGYEVRRVLEQVQKVTHAVDTVARTHSDTELAWLERHGVGFAVMGERQLALAMTGYALRSLGVEEDDARTVLKTIAGQGRALGQDTDGVVIEPPRSAPELRPHRNEDTPILVETEAVAVDDETPKVG